MVHTARMYLQRQLRQWGAGNVYLLVLSRWKVNIAKNIIAVMRLRWNYYEKWYMMYSFNNLYICSIWLIWNNLITYVQLLNIPFLNCKWLGLLCKEDKGLSKLPQLHFYLLSLCKGLLCSDANSACEVVGDQNQF